LNDAYNFNDTLENNILNIDVSSIKLKLVIIEQNDDWLKA
jgi:hypothetical protein